MQDQNSKDNLFEEIVGDEYSYLLNEIKNAPGEAAPEDSTPEEAAPETGKAPADAPEAEAPLSEEDPEKTADREFEDILNDVAVQEDESSDDPSEAPVPEEEDAADAELTDMDAEDESRPEPAKRPKTRRGRRVYDAYDQRAYQKGQFPIHRRNGRKFGCLPGILYMLMIIAIGIILGAVAWMAASDVMAFGKDDEQVQVTIPESALYEVQEEVTDDDGNTSLETVKRADIDQVTQILKDNELIKYEKLFKLFCKISHADRKISAGSFVVNRNYDYHALIGGLRQGSGIRVEQEVTIPEGYTMTQIFTLLEQEGVCSAAELADAAANYDFDFDFLDDGTLGQAKRLEGFLFPDTYNFYIGDNPEDVIDRFLSNFNVKYTAEYRQAVADSGYSLREILTIASMIEKEAGGDSERATIASVIYNRLASEGDYAYLQYLQIDATIYYAIAETGEAFSTDVDSVYNTYQYPGLPPTPIANPGMASIRAALYPEDTDYRYYALGHDNLHEFFRYYDDFEAFINSEDFAG